MNLSTATYPCPVCASTVTKRRYEVNGFHIVQCTACSMVFVNPRIRTEELFSIYRDEYFHRGREFGYENYELTAPLRIKTFRRWLDDCKPFLAAGAEAAFDIGCAAGYFLDLLRQDGWRHIEGIELDPRMAAALRGRGYGISESPLERFAPSRKYQLITIFDVLEHLPEINSDFDKLAAMLDDRGILVLVTPNFAGAQRRIFGRRWFQFKPREHICYYSPGTLRRIAANHGFEVVHLSKSGQYADFDFLHDRLATYRFPLLEKLFSAVCAVLKLKKNFWYVDTGSMFAVLKKTPK